MSYRDLRKPGMYAAIRKLKHMLPHFLRGYMHAQSITPPPFPDGPEAAGSNPLLDFFNADIDKRGVWKWLHYFDIYHRHFSKFVGQEVHILEIGVMNGGSLQMWQSYFGPRCHVYGVDNDPRCSALQNEQTTIFIGDQADPAFWKTFREQVPVLDIIVDDGGHLPDQQIITLEETLPLLRAGGVYLCEDVHGDTNSFAAYIHGLAHHLNAQHRIEQELLVANMTPFQQTIASVHLYPYVAVIEKQTQRHTQLIAPKKGKQVL